MKIMVFGDSASGKSTFATKLSQKLSIPVIHLDEVMETIGRENKEKIREVIAAEANKSNWIIEGNAFTKDKEGLRIQQADYIFVFEATPLLTFYRHLIRYIKIKLGYEQRTGSKSIELNLGYFIPYIFYKFPKRRRTQVGIARKYGKNLTIVKGYKHANSILSSFSSNS